MENAFSENLLNLATFLHDVYAVKCLVFFVLSFAAIIYYWTFYAGKEREDDKKVITLSFLQFSFSFICIYFFIDYLVCIIRPEAFFFLRHPEFFYYEFPKFVPVPGGNL